MVESEKIEVRMRPQDVTIMREYRLDPSKVLQLLGTSFCGILTRHETAGQALRDFTEPKMIREIKKTAEIMQKEREDVNKRAETRKRGGKKKVLRDIDAQINGKKT